MDIAGTVRWAPPMTDAALATALAGTPLRTRDHLHERTLKRYNPVWMWAEITDDGGLFRSPTDEDHDDAAIARAWRTIVLAHPGAYLHHRWDVFRELLVLPGAHPGAAVYTWFTDIQDLHYTAKLIDHDAAPSRAQHVLQPIAHWLDRTVLYRPWLYLVGLLALAPFVRRDRIAIALIASGLVSELRPVRRRADAGLSVLDLGRRHGGARGGVRARAPHEAGVIDVKPVASRAWRWLAARSPRQLLIAGWLGCVLLCYPGYLSFDSIEQLGQVRSGDFSDAYPPIMSFVWRLLEWVFAGPFLVLALQMGLFLFGAYAIARRVLVPRAAALVAIGVLVAPPVFAPMAVIWPDSLAAGALLAAVAAVLDGRRAMRVAAAILLVVACGCRPGIAIAAIPLALVAIPSQAWWRRGLAAIAIVVACAATAWFATWLLVDHQTYAAQQRLEWVDLTDTLKRAHDTTAALEGLPIVDRTQIGSTATNAYAMTHGPKRLADPISTDDESDALSAAWRAAIADHPGAYAMHRVRLFERQLALGGTWNPVFDEFGDPGHLVMLHHRATPSDLEIGWRAIVRAFAATPMFRPWLYVVLAVGLLVVARRRRELWLLVASGVVAELTLFVLAGSADYRWSHWLVATTWLAAVILAAARRPAWRAVPSDAGPEPAG